MYSSHSHANVVQIKLEIANFRKGNVSMVEYFNKIRMNTNHIAAPSHPMRNVDIITTAVTCPERDYELLITAATTHLDVMTL